uniref:Uncharacterized protein n=1 Tax=Ditylenchus dipsaci TaxID=166011 RepID=A0A915EDD3_9BILA
MQCDVKLGHRESGAGDERAPFDLESMLLLQHPILPPNPHFFCCFNKLHITAAAKALSLIYAIFYGFLCFLSYKSDHSVAFLVSVLVAASVGISTLYATFKWSKLCLIPFFLLQAMLILYVVVCIFLLFFAIISPSSSFVYQELDAPLNGFLNLSTTVWIFGLMAGFMLLTLFFLYSSLLFWFDYQFIAEVDRFLKSIQKSSSNASKDDQNGGNGRDYINQQI